MDPAPDPLFFWPEMKCLSLVCLLLGLAGCSRAPEPYQTPAQQEQRRDDQPSTESSSPALDAQLSSANASPSPLSSPAALIPQFASPEATEGVQAYAAAMAELKNQPTPPPNIGQQALSNPSSITASLNQLSAKLNALGAAKQQVEANLAPGEQQRWKAFQKSLDQPP